MNEPVEVVPLDSVEVDEDKLSDAGPGERLGNKRSHAPKSHDTDSKPRDVVLQ